MPEQRAEQAGDLRWHQAGPASGVFAMSLEPSGADLFYGNDQVGIVVPVQGVFGEPWHWWWSASGKGIPARRTAAEFPSREAAKAACEEYVRMCLGLPARKAEGS
jgi:hypothetical protein